MQQYAIVYFPHNNLCKLNSFRKKYDPNWKIIEPHITLVFPLSDISEESLIIYLEKVTKEIKSFPIVLKGLTMSFDNYLFLQIKEGNGNIIEVHNKLYSGMLAPYLRTDILFVPHITLGYFNTADNKLNKKLFEKAYKEWEEMNINILDNFNNITLIKGDGLSPAVVTKTFKLKI